METLLSRLSSFIICVIEREENLFRAKGSNNTEYIEWENILRVAPLTSLALVSIETLIIINKREREESFHNHRYGKEQHMNIRKYSKRERAYWISVVMASHGQVSKCRRLSRNCSPLYVCSDYFSPLFIYFSASLCAAASRICLILLIFLLAQRAKHSFSRSFCF